MAYQIYCYAQEEYPPEHRTGLVNIPAVEVESAVGRSLN